MDDQRTNREDGVGTWDHAFWPIFITIVLPIGVLHGGYRAWAEQSYKDGIWALAMLIVFVWWLRYFVRWWKKT
jgi:hypothetical protein